MGLTENGAINLSLTDQNLSLTRVEFPSRDGPGNVVMEYDKLEGEATML